jgi:hypothetical protein
MIAGEQDRTVSRHFAVRANLEAEDSDAEPVVKKRQPDRKLSIEPHGESLDGNKRDRYGEISGDPDKGPQRRSH